MKDISGYNTPTLPCSLKHLFLARLASTRPCVCVCNVISSGVEVTDSLWLSMQYPWTTALWGGGRGLSLHLTPVLIRRSVLHYIRIHHPGLEGMSLSDTIGTGDLSVRGTRGYVKQASRCPMTDGEVEIPCHVACT